MATVSFKTDVIPVFQQSCTLSMVCHGQMNNSAEESLYLGENMGTTDPNAVYNMLVGVKAKEIPSMNLVTASDLENSFLWHKINDNMTTLNAEPLASQCAMATAKCSDCNMSQPCGATMPYLGAAHRPDLRLHDPELDRGRRAEQLNRRPRRGEPPRPAREDSWFTWRLAFSLFLRAVST